MKHVSSLDVLKLFQEHHNPDRVKLDDFYIVFVDGEIASTKGGELFGQRSLHRLAHPFISQETLENFLDFCKDEGKCPRVLGYAGAIVKDRETATMLRTHVAEWVKNMIDNMVSCEGFSGITPKR